MKNRKIKNASNETIGIEVIRYFTNNNIEYLIYSLNEIDESGYTKLYASKIIGTMACIIDDNEEWNLIKLIIKEIVKSNRDGSKLNVIDLDEENLNDIILQDTRVFKLQGNLVNLLSENRNVLKSSFDDIAFIPDDEDSGISDDSQEDDNFEDDDSEKDDSDTSDEFKETDEEETLEDNEENEVCNSYKEKLEMLIDKVDILESKILSYEAMLNKIKNIIDNNLE